MTTGELPVPDEILDTGIEGCGDLVMTLLRKFKQLTAGQVIEVISRDPGAVEDIPAWCRMRGHTLLCTVSSSGATRFFIRCNG